RIVEVLPELGRDELRTVCRAHGIVEDGLGRRSAGEDGLARDALILHTLKWADLQVPPYCPKTPSEGEAYKAAEDQVIDRLYVLDAERAREEQRLGLGKKAGKSGRRSKSKDLKDDGGQIDLL
ncbi:MAG: hypothetical protein HC927_01965, partial [Deltaproteobacteria bacterium]|nr:hypothetical protein [Deltaproteobacteria bacterium]